MPIRVLLVDDEPALLDITKIFLQRESEFSVVTAHSGKKALEFLDTEPFDVIISDYEMPWMDGLTLLSTIRERGMSLPFIIFTGKGREEVVIEALNRGADFYLQKGGDPKSQFAELKSKIIHAVEKKRAEEIARTAYAKIEKSNAILEEQNQRLEESEAKFRNLADSTSVAILIHQDNRWIYANPAAERMCGFSAEEICTMEFWERVAPEFQEIVKERGQFRELGRNTPNTYELKILTKTGEEAWAYLRGSTTEYQGRPAGLISVIDITERKKMETALREQEDNYRTLLNSMSDTIFILDERDRFTGIHHNKGLLYAPPEDFLGKHFRDVMPGKIYGQYSIAADILRETKKTQYYEYQLEIGNEQNWFEATLNLQEDGPGIVAVIRDITDRKQMEEALRENEARYRTLVENIPIGLIQANTTGEIIYVNPQIYEIFGTSPIKSTEELNQLLYPHIQDSGIRTDIQTAMVEKRAVEGEYKYLSKGGADCYVRYRMAPLDTNGEMTEMLTIVEDITVRRQAEDALRLANHKLGLLSRVTRHDILNDIMDAKGHLELNEAEYPASGTPYLTAVEKAITRIEREIEFTAEYQALGTSPPKWQKVRQVTEDSLNQMDVPDVIQTEMDISPVEVYADQLLTLAFSNIIRNALVHAKGIAKITVITREVPGGELCIAIEDDGTGIPLEKKEAILQPTYNRRSGHGLYLVRDILDLTGISIRETGKPGEGARFELIVPAGRWRHFMEDAA
ncbi:response regulator [Methanogenium organophilum]|uniref:histidine kinase n=1 Tax=Methanogenium organophilum TaxID=2199 RepID=A0A9X9T9D4_METOG|nr:response regulator [Methanogenium organophilum]WAI01992.1 PAS domain S-box protein [Methanogenium organophilum]